MNTTSSQAGDNFADALGQKSSAETCLKLPKEPQVNSHALEYIRTRQKMLDILAERCVPDSYALHDDPTSKFHSLRITNPEQASELTIASLLRHKCACLVKAHFLYWNKGELPSRKVTEKEIRPAIKCIERKLPHWIVSPSVSLKGNCIEIRFANLLSDKIAARLHKLAKELCAGSELPIVLKQHLKLPDVLRIMAQELQCSGWDLKLRTSEHKLHIVFNAREDRDLEAIKHKLMVRTGFEVLVTARDEQGLPPVLRVNSALQKPFKKEILLIESELPAWIHEASLEIENGKFTIQHGNDLDFEPRLNLLAPKLTELVGEPVEVKRRINDQYFQRIIFEECSIDNLGISICHKTKRLSLRLSSAPEVSMVRAIDAIERRSGYRVVIRVSGGLCYRVSTYRQKLTEEYSCACVKGASPTWAYVSRVRLCDGVMVVNIRNELSRMGDLSKLQADLQKATHYPVKIEHSFSHNNIFRVVASVMKQEGWWLSTDVGQNHALIRFHEGLKFDREAVAQVIKERTGFNVDFQQTDGVVSTEQGLELWEKERIVAEELGTSHFRLYQKGNCLYVHVYCELDRPMWLLKGAISDRTGLKVAFVKKASPNISRKFSLDEDLEAIDKISRALPKELGAHTLKVSSLDFLSIEYMKKVSVDYLQKVTADLSSISRFKVKLIYAHKNTPTSRAARKLAKHSKL